MINTPKPTGYQGREIDAKARKDREDKQRQLALAKRQLELKEMDLKVHEDKHASLRREITRLENQPQKSTTVTSETSLNVQGFEREVASKIAEKEKEIRTLEQEVTKIDTDLQTKGLLITQREQEEREDARHIMELKEEIRRKTQELKMAEGEDQMIQKEIGQLKIQPSTKKIAEKEAVIQSLKKDIMVLNQNLELKRLSVEKAKKDFAVVRQQVDEHQKLLQTKIQEAVLAVNRINGIKDDIRLIQNRIQALQR